MTWEEAIEQAIKAIPFATYSQKGGQEGVSENIYWQKKLLLKAGDIPSSHCVGAVGEAIVRAFKLLELEKIIPYEDMKYFKEFGFIYDEEEQFDGYPGALVELEWGNWVDEDEVEYGDLAQYWHEDDNENRKQGHALILTGIGKYKNKDVFKDWSATNLSSINGHGYDWHLVDKELKSGYNRIWYIARPDINMIKFKYL